MSKAKKPLDARTLRYVARALHHGARRAARFPSSNVFADSDRAWAGRFTSEARAIERKAKASKRGE